MFNDFFLLVLQVWFQNRRARQKRQVKKRDGCQRLTRSPSYEEFSPSSSTSSSRPSSVEPPSPEIYPWPASVTSSSSESSHRLSSEEPPSPEVCPWSTIPASSSSSPAEVPNVPSPPSGRCREVCCSPPAINLSLSTYLNFAELDTCSIEELVSKYLCN